ncbi:prepilin-type N-terminal cleavage/methylation domain-containing protein [Litoribrevibacter albus]|nr:prepilin-type N-terminal cleavage/methylation domain-containing protein [Litoribrevibacter albus]
MKNRIHKGYTLVEVLVAVLIASVLMAAVVRLFTKVGETFELNADALQLMESTRVALKFVKSDLTQAGYMGCVFTDINPKKADESLDKLIRTATSLVPDSYWGVAGQDGGSNPDSLSLFYMQDLDVRVISRDTIGQFFPEPAFLVDAKNVFDSNGNSLISKGDWLVASNCENATSFILTNDPEVLNASAFDLGGLDDGIADGSVARLDFSTGESFDGFSNQLNLGDSREISASYNASASGGATFIGRYFDVRYVVADSEIDEGSTKSLFRLINGETPSTSNEIVRLVEDFQVFYGVDDDNDGITDWFVDSLSDVTGRNKPVQIKVSITIQGGNTSQELVNMVKVRNKGL